MTRPGRCCSEGSIPLINVSGTAAECGRYLGFTWAQRLHRAAVQYPPKSVPWWKDKQYHRLVAQVAPHLPEVYRGMARGAELREDLVSQRADMGEEGCTSFAIKPSATLDGLPISGQTKDTPTSRIFQFQVLRMNMTDAPSALTLTYEGWLFGHGFIEGGCSIFRNSLWVGQSSGRLPYSIWGILALHCRDVEQVMKLTRDHGICGGCHMTVADEHGGIVGIEVTRAGISFLRPKQGIYTHANALMSSKRLLRHEKSQPPFTRRDSLHRQTRLYDRLAAHRGRLTAQLAMGAFADHDGYPTSLCRHQGSKATTCSAVVVEPGKGLLHATRGNPCQNWPTTYKLH